MDCCIQYNIKSSSWLGQLTKFRWRGGAKPIPPLRGVLTSSALIYYNVYNKNGTSLICRWKHQILQKSWRLSPKLRCVASQWPVIISNIIIILRINYTIKMVMCINNAIITTNYGKPKDLFTCSKFPRVLERISSKFVKQFGHAPSKKCASTGLRILLPWVLPNVTFTVIIDR